MPRIFGLNLVSVLLAAIAAFFVGFVFYGLIFNAIWPVLWGFSEEKLALMEAKFGATMAAGFLVSFVTAAFLSLTTKALGAVSLTDAIQRAILLWAGFAATTLAYDMIYAHQPMMLWIIDASHLLVAYVAAATVLNLTDGLLVKDAG